MIEEGLRFRREDLRASAVWRIVTREKLETVGCLLARGLENQQPRLFMAGLIGECNLVRTVDKFGPGSPTEIWIMALGVSNILASGPTESGPPTGIGRSSVQRGGLVVYGATGLLPSFLFVANRVAGRGGLNRRQCLWPGRWRASLERESMKEVAGVPAPAGKW